MPSRSILSAFSLLSLLQLLAPSVVADPGYRLSTGQMSSVLSCPGSNINNLKGKDVLLMVPGTGGTAALNWDQGYVKLAPSLGKTPCTISPPPAMLGDISLNAEYVVYAIKTLSSKAGKPISVMTWSQGGLATQWAFNFFPSTRSMVKSFFAFAPDFRGTTIDLPGAILNAAQLSTGLNLLGLQPSLFQQAQNSMFVQALESCGGLNQLVPTTAVNSYTDEIVQPPSSGQLQGGVHLIVNDANICPGKVLTHEGFLADGYVYTLVKQAFSSPSGRVDFSNPGDRSVCYDPVQDQLTPANGAFLNLAIVNAGLAIGTTYLGAATLKEPWLPDYVNTCFKQTEDKRKKFKGGLKLGKILGRSGRWVDAPVPNVEG